MKILRAMPVLQVSGIARATAFRGCAGFAGHGLSDGMGETFFTIARRDEVTVGLQLLRGAIPVNTHRVACIYVSDFAALHADFTAADLDPADIRHSDACDRDDFDIGDPDGHPIAFGQSHDPEPPSTRTP